MAGKYDEMSFGKAFAAARKEKGSGKTFTWRGKSYTTNYKEEEEAKRPTRPRARPNDKVPTATSAKTPEVTTTRLSNESGGRGSGVIEVATRAIDRAENEDKRGNTPRSERKEADKPTKEYTWSEWQRMSRAERRAAGLPVSFLGGQIEFNRFMSGITGKDYTARGRGMAKGGLVKANCGASMKPNRMSRT